MIKFTVRIATPSTARTTPVALFRVTALALLANLAAILAHSSVEARSEERRVGNEC